MLAWLTARHALGQQDPYFAPLAALLGVYPTIVTSMKEGLRYAAGFLAGAALAIPVGLWLGPVTGIAATVLAGVLVSGWRGFGDQGPQVPFTALFAVLLGGEGVVSYVLPRLADVGVGVCAGLAVNVLVFPPLHLRRCENAVRRFRADIAGAAAELAETVAAAEPDWNRWDRAENRLSHGERTARDLYHQACESLRGNPRAWWHGGAWDESGRMRALAELADRLRAVAAVARRADGSGLDPGFRREYAELLRSLAGPIRCLTPGGTPGERATLAAAGSAQRRLEGPHRRAGTDRPGLWDPEKELLSLSAAVHRLLSGPTADR